MLCFLFNIKFICLGKIILLKNKDYIEEFVTDVG